MICVNGVRPGHSYEIQGESARIGEETRMPLDLAVVRNDLSYLQFRQRVERGRAKEAASDAARKAHADLADLYQQRIEQLSAGNLRFPACEPLQLSA